MFSKNNLAFIVTLGLVAVTAVPIDEEVETAEYIVVGGMDN